MRLLGGLRAVLHPTRDHEQLAFGELDVAIAQVDRQPALDDEEEVVGLIVLVPDERPVDLDDLELQVVQVADDAGLIGSLEELELLRQVDLIVDLDPPWVARR